MDWGKNVGMFDKSDNVRQFLRAEQNKTKKTCRRGTDRTHQRAMHNYHAVYQYSISAELMESLCRV